MHVLGPLDRTPRSCFDNGSDDLITGLGVTKALQQFRLPDSRVKANLGSHIRPGRHARAPLYRGPANSPSNRALGIRPVDSSHFDGFLGTI